MTPEDQDRAVRTFRVDSFEVTYPAGRTVDLGPGTIEMGPYPAEEPGPMTSPLDRYISCPRQWRLSIPDDDVLEALRIEAGAAGDADMVATCDAALAGDDGARARCAQAIAEARARVDDDDAEDSAR